MSATTATDGAEAAVAEPEPPVERRNAAMAALTHPATKVSGIGLAGLGGVLLALWQLGVIDIAGKSAGASAPAPVVADGEDAPPPRPKTAERVAALEATVSDLKAVVSDTRDKVGELKLDQVRQGARLEAIDDRTGRMETDQRARFDRIMDKIDDIRVAAHRGGAGRASGHGR